MPSRIDRDDDVDMSWVEARRLIISNLRNVDTRLGQLSEKIEQMQEKARERDRVFEARVETRIGDLNTRMAMMELRAKMWGGAIGFIGGGVASALADIVIGKLAR